MTRQKLYACFVCSTLRGELRVRGLGTVGDRWGEVERLQSPTGIFRSAP